ncbi:MAG: DinB family protein [Saprospiraceae bacterium]
MNTSTYHKAEIVKSLVLSLEEVRGFIEQLTEEQFEHKPTDKWSIKQEFEHLILSNKPVSSALKLPKLVLRSFGKPRNPSRKFEALFDYYHGKLKTSPVPTGKFTPKEQNNLSRTDMLMGWGMISKKFDDRILNWSEEKLDQYLLPHPLLGKLTVREMLFFTIFHNHHHLSNMQDKLAQV